MYVTATCKALQLWILPAQHARAAGDALDVASHENVSNCCSVRREHAAVGKNETTSQLLYCCASYAVIHSTSTFGIHWS